MGRLLGRWDGFTSLSSGQEASIDMSSYFYHVISRQLGTISQGDGGEGAASTLFLGLSCPLGWTIIASSQTDIIGLLPPKKKSKRIGFLHKLFSNPGREKKIRDLERALGGLAVQEPALPCGEPTEPQPMLQRLCAPKRGTGRAWRIEQLGAQIGAGQPQGWDATAAWYWHRKRPPSRHAGPFMQSGHLRVWCWLLSSCMWPGAVAHCIPPRRLRGGRPAFKPKGQIGRAHGLPALGSWFSCKPSPRKPLELSRRILPCHSAPFSYIAS